MSLIDDRLSLEKDRGDVIVRLSDKIRSLSLGVIGLFWAIASSDKSAVRSERNTPFCSLRWEVWLSSRCC